MKKIDAATKWIIKTLQSQGRAQINHLAKAVGIKPQSMAERLQRLESRGIITEYRAIVDPSKLGLHVTTFVMVRLIANKRLDMALFQHDMEQQSCVTEVFLLKGYYDYMIKSYHQDTVMQEKFIRTLADHVNVQCVQAMESLSCVLDREPDAGLE